MREEILWWKEKAEIDLKAAADQLRDIVTKHGMPFSAVGSLVVGRYVKKDGKGYAIRSGAQRSGEDAGR